ncbi:MAG: AMP-binding protein, partial [Bacteroidota bacterium]|nr:AMP-binding protein [Bacteroidota bacterium]
IFPEPNKQETALLIYTSGTTGSPKGVMLSYENILFNVEAVTNKVKIISEGEILMILLPLHHIFPLLGTLIAPFYKSLMVAMSPSLASEDIIKTLQDNKVSVFVGVPRLFNIMRKGIMSKIDENKIARLLFKLAGKVDSYKFSRKIFKQVHEKFGGGIKYMIAGGAALDPVVGNDFRTLGFEILEGYGMTETSPMITFTQPGTVKVGAPGFIIEGAEAEIRDGEIVCRGPNVMQGYYNRPEETADIIKDGWLYTGDIGHFDEQGYIHITGRKKEIIVLSNGKNINPAEIEFQLEEISPLIKEAGVFMKNDVLHAILSIDPATSKQMGISNIEDEVKTNIIEAYNKASSPSKKLLGYNIIEEELPKTRLGKIQHFKLPGLIENIQKKQVDIEESNLKEYHIIKHFLEQEKGVSIKPGDNLEFDLALDSLDKVGLQVFIEMNFGLKLQPEEIVAYPTILKLSEMVHEKKQKMTEEKINWAEILSEKIHIHLPKSWITSSIIIKLSKYFFYLYFRINSKGKAKMPDTPCIIAPNHQSYIDGLFVAAMIKTKNMRNTYFYAKEKHVKQRWLKFFAGRNNVIIMDINKDLKLSIQKMAEALKNKRNIIIFPEGTRTKDGSLGQFKKTFAILSRELNVPIIPVAINGAYNAMPSGSIFPKPFKKICVEFLDPIHPENHSYDSLTEKVKGKIETQLKRDILSAC